MIQAFILQIISTLFTFLPVQNDRIWVDQFNEPLEESWKNRYEECTEIYRIEEQAENKYLSALSTDSDCFIVKPIKVDITKYPYLNWKWKNFVIFIFFKKYLTKCFIDHIHFFLKISVYFFL